MTSKRWMHMGKPNFLDSIHDIALTAVNGKRCWVDVQRGGNAPILVVIHGPDAEDFCAWRFKLDKRIAKELWRHRPWSELREYIETQIAIMRLTDGA